MNRRTCWHSLAAPFLAAALVTCAPAAQVDLSPALWPAGELERHTQLNERWGRPKTVVEAATAMVTGTTGALAIRAGVEALKQGGSAIDAAVTTSLAQIALAGGAWVSYDGIFNLMYYDAATKKVHSLNAGWNTFTGETDPLSIPFCPTTSGRTAMVGGFMAGIEAAHQRFGKLPWARLFEPAIYFAEHGVPVSPTLAAMIASRRDVLSRRPDTKAVFTTPNGEFYARGDLFRQPAMAGTLRNVAAHGAGYLYSGAWARHFVEAVRSDGGKASLEDRAAYRPIWSEPARTTYREYQVLSSPPPNFGGTKIIEGMNLLERANLSRDERYWQAPDALYWLTQIAHLSYLLGPNGAGYGVGERWLANAFPGVGLSLPSRARKETASALWARMQAADWSRLKQDAARESQRVSAEAAKSQTPPSGHSDAVVVVDAAGNMAALTHSINAAIWGWTGIMVDGVSIADAGCYMQDLMHKAGPGARLPDPTNPVIVLKDGAPFVGGASVGQGLHENTLQILVNLLDYGLDPQTALDSPQFARPEWDDRFNVLYVQGYPEPDFGAEVVEGVRARGQEVLRRPKMQLIGGVGWWISIKRDPKTGKLQGSTGQIHNGLTAGY